MAFGSASRGEMLAGCCLAAGKPGASRAREEFLAAVLPSATGLIVACALECFHSCAGAQ